MYKKRSIYLVLFLCSILFITGCSCKKENKFDPDENLNPKNAFFDDFTNGIDSTRWEICNEQWGVGNGGVVPANVSYTSDGLLLLQANGDYYEGPIQGIGRSDGKRTGAALKSTESYGPGRYEIRMKAMPRFGATTAFWTYYNDGQQNAEIDIELNVKNDFYVSQFTNWIALKQFSSYPMETPVLNNDNQFHTYKFEWHTNPNRVDYYVDDVLYCTSTSYVPQTEGRLWLGVWFPDAWAGTPDFETDYMVVDWVKYTSYSNNPCTSIDVNANVNPSYYPTSPIEMPKNNMISNASFDNINKAWDLSIESDCKIENGELVIPKDNITYQMITAIDDTMTLTYKMKYKLEENSSGQVLFEYRPLATELISKQSIALDGSHTLGADGWYSLDINLNLPKGTKRIELSFIGIEGTTKIDDVYLNWIGK